MLICELMDMNIYELIRGKLPSVGIYGHCSHVYDSFFIIFKQYHCESVNFI